MFIRGSVVRYVMLPRSEVDIGLLEDATRRGTWATTSPCPYSRGFWSQCLHESICRSREPGWKGPVISSPLYHPLCSLLLSSRSRCVAYCISGMSCLQQTTGRLRDVRGFGRWIFASGIAEQTEDEVGRFCSTVSAWIYPRIAT